MRVYKYGNTEREDNTVFDASAASCCPPASNSSIPTFKFLSCCVDRFGKRVITDFLLFNLGEAPDLIRA